MKVAEGLALGTGAKGTNLEGSMVRQEAVRPRHLDWWVRSASPALTR